MNIVLFEPEIPQNTGNIARTCAAVHGTLHLIKPLGFSVDDKHLKRAGLDYWELLNIRYYDNFEHFITENNTCLLYMATTKAKKIYTGVSYSDDCFIMFGKETKGIPEDILSRYEPFLIRIPMISGARCLNLSNAVAVVVYEALRQQNFKGLTCEGGMT